jgi:hypothetical protein
VEGERKQWKHESMWDFLHVFIRSRLTRPLGAIDEAMRKATLFPLSCENRFRLRFNQAGHQLRSAAIKGHETGCVTDKGGDSKNRFRTLDGPDSNTQTACRRDGSGHQLDVTVSGEKRRERDAAQPFLPPSSFLLRCPPSSRTHRDERSSWTRKREETRITQMKEGNSWR